MKTLTKVLPIGCLLALGVFYFSLEKPKIKNTYYKGFKVELKEKENSATMFVKDTLNGHELFARDYDKDGELDDCIYTPPEVNSIRDSLSQHLYTAQRIYDCVMREDD